MNQKVKNNLQCSNNRCLSIVVLLPFENGIFWAKNWIEMNKDHSKRVSEQVSRQVKEYQFKIKEVREKLKEIDQN